jgi:hypothetical protein
MTAGREPERWLSADDDVANRLRPVLPMARGAGPSASEHARMWNSLSARLPSVAAEGGAQATTTTSVSRIAAKPSWWWVVGTGVVATLFGFATAVFLTRATPAAPPRPPMAASAAPRPAPSPGPPGLASSPDARAAEQPSPASGAQARERPVVQPERSAARPRKPASPAAPRSVAIAAPTPTAAGVGAAPVDLGAELDLLARARRVVASEPGRALQLTAEHAQRFHDGVLTQEREVLAIDALSRLGHRDLAAARARRFIERYPDSAHRVRLAAALEAP